MHRKHISEGCSLSSYLCCGYILELSLRKITMSVQNIGFEGVQNRNSFFELQNTQYSLKVSLPLSNRTGSNDDLPHSHMTPFDGSGKEPFLKTLWEKEKLLVQAISPIPTMFSTLSKIEIIIFVTFFLSSAYAFNLVCPKFCHVAMG